MTAFEKIIDLLNNSQIKYKLVEHEPVFTSAQAAEVRGTLPEQGAKALVMSADDTPIMLVLPGNLRVDTKKFKSEFGFKNLQMATPEKVEELVGVKVGAVPPFGNLFNLKTFVDLNLGNNSQIAFNAGDHAKSIIMDYTDFLKVNPATESNFSQ